MTRTSRLRTSLATTGSTWRTLHGGSDPGAPQLGYREKSLVLNSALHEYRRLREQGTPVAVGEFCDKYPDYRKSLLRLIDVQENLGDLGEIDDPFPQIGGAFLGFEILEELGFGAIARVYLASEPELGGRIVVIKVAAEGTAEAATLGKLQHPNIVQVHSVKRDAESGMSAVCMPYQGSATLTDVMDLAFRDGHPPESAEGILDVASRLADRESLRDDELATSRPDPVLVHGSFVDGVVHLGIQLADALEYAHSLGVLHRDLKPSNILLTPHGRPMLLDFNLAFDAAQDAMPRGGTLPYMAPEQIRACISEDAARMAGLDPRADVFSLGVILYELLTGKLPYGGPPEHLGPEAASLWQLDAHDTPPPPIRAANPRVPAPIADAIERCLAIDPSQRCPSLAELSTALNKHFSRWQRFVRWLNRHAWWCRAAALACVLVVAAAGAYFALRPPLHVRQYHAALRHYEQKDYDQAISVLGPVINDHSDFVHALELRGVCQTARNRRKEAAADFEQVTRIAPSAAAWDHWGCESYVLGRRLDAMAQFDEAIKLAPEHAKLYVKYAIAASKMSETWSQAEMFANSAIQLDRGLAEAYLIRAEIQVKSGNSDGVIQDLEAAIQIEPNSKLVRLFVAEQYCRMRGRSTYMKKIQHHLGQAVALGLSKNSLQSSIAYTIFQNESWCHELLNRAPSGIQEGKSPLHQIMIPSLAFEFEQF